jgi:hypothetical protein
MYQQEVVRFCHTGQQIRKLEAMHPISGLKTLKRQLTKGGGISITIRLFMGALLGGR